MTCLKEQVTQAAVWMGAAVVSSISDHMSHVVAAKITPLCKACYYYIDIVVNSHATEQTAQRLNVPVMTMEWIEACWIHACEQASFVRSVLIFSIYLMIYL